MDEIINLDLTEAVKSEKKLVKQIGELSKRLAGKNSEHWNRIVDIMFQKLPKHERLALIERFYGKISSADFAMLIEFISVEQVCAYLGIEQQEIALLFNNEQISDAGKAGLMLSACPTGLTLKGVQEKLTNRILPEEKFLYSGNKNDGWYQTQDEKFYTTTQSRGEYYFSPKVGLLGSEKKNYFQQTEMLPAWLMQYRHLSAKPELIDEAIEDFNSKKEALAKTLKRDWQEGGRQLTDLMINQNFRERSVEFAIRMASYRKLFGSYLHSSEYVWLNDFSSGSGVVLLGHGDADGIVVYRWDASGDGDGNLRLVPRLQ